MSITFRAGSLIVILTALFSMSALTAVAQTKGFSYKITPVPRADRTVVEISLSFQNNDSAPIKVGMPMDCFGTPDLSKYVTKFEGAAGTIVKAGDKPTEMTVQPNSDGTVSLRYSLSFDPKVMAASPYAPNTSAEHFHLAGCQYLLPIGDPYQKVRYQFEITDAPKAWQIYSTSSANPVKYEVESSYDNLSSTAIGGGRHVYVFYTKKGRVAVFVHGDFLIPREKIYASIEQIIRAERKWFDDHDQPNYTIVVAPRSNVRAGFAPDNAFICFIDPGIGIDDLSLLVAHEFFHNWLPNKIEIVQDKKYADLRYEWFSEGFTDYFARIILRDAKLLTEEQYVSALNRNIYDIFDNPHRTLSYDELSGLGKIGKFDGVAKKLAYFRGALIALNWDAQIRRGSKTQDLSDFIRSLYKLASKTGGKIDESFFYRFSSDFGIDAERDLDHFITHGQTIEPDKRALGEGYELRELEKPAFNIGFSLEETQKTRKITGVKENGPAYNAGLRDGLEFVSVENAYRFSNSWKDDKPLAVTVRVDGIEKRFEYFPHGAAMKLPQFFKLTGTKSPPSGN